LTVEFSGVEGQRSVVSGTPSESESGMVTTENVAVTDVLDDTVTVH